MAMICAITPSTFADEIDHELRHAIEFLEGRTEVRQRYEHVVFSRGSWAVAGVGTGILALSPLVAIDYFEHLHVLGAGLLVTAVIMNVAGRLIPMTLGHNLLPDEEDLLKPENINYFFALPRERQYRVAHRHPELRDFVVQLAQKYEFVLYAQPTVVTP